MSEESLLLQKQQAEMMTNLMTMMSAEDPVETVKKNPGMSTVISICCYIIILIMMFIFIGIFGKKYYENKKKMDFQKAKTDFIAEEERVRELIKNEENKKKEKDRKLQEYNNQLPCTDPQYFKDKSTNFKCVLKQCTCTNGLKGTGMTCPENGMEFCQACNDGYHLDYDNLCVKNICTCVNGTNAKDDNCLEDGDHACTSCLNGYGLTEGLRCNIRKCICDKGIPETGIDCPVQDQVLCKSCNDDYFKDSKKNCKKFLPYKVRYNNGTNLSLPPGGFRPNGCCFYIVPKQTYPIFKMGQPLLIVDTPTISDKMKKMKWTVWEANKHISDKKIINYKICADKETEYQGRNDDDNSCFVYDDELKTLEDAQTNEEGTWINIIRDYKKKNR
jgi:hypothetical protein